MRVRILRKILLILLVVVPAFMVMDCKKQPKCGCNGDAVQVLTNEQAIVSFNETGTYIAFTPLNDPYSQYSFCNPEEMFPKLADAKSGDILQVSGEAYWDCNYVMQSSNYYYGYSYRVYNIHVTNVFADLYGKKK